LMIGLFIVRVGFKSFLCRSTRKVLKKANQCFSCSVFCGASILKSLIQSAWLGAANFNWAWVLMYIRVTIQKRHEGARIKAHSRFLFHGRAPISFRVPSKHFGRHAFCDWFYHGTKKLARNILHSLVKLTTPSGFILLSHEKNHLKVYQK